MSGPTVPTTGEWAAAHSPVVVGVDGSEGSADAVDWAATEAGRTGADLRLVAVAEGRHLPRFPLRLGHDDAAKLVERLAASVYDRVPPAQVSTEVYDGHPAEGLLEHLGHARMLVVGKRGQSALPRLIVGSTSLAVAGRADVPVAVVPTGWDERAHEQEGVVVGVDPYRENRRLLHLAFRRAQRLGARLVAVHGWEAPGAPVWSDAPVDEWERESHERFDQMMASWQERYPGVDLSTVSSSHHPAVALLDEADQGSRLVVLGRRSGSRAHGFPFGSVTRAVLHYSSVPVLVVPTAEE
ncbi:MAG: universal stress protein [Actinomycetes bacterium]